MMPRFRRSARPGFALVATVVAMVLVGTVVTIGFYSAAGHASPPPSAAERAALDVAERGIGIVLEEWDVYRLARLPARGDTTFLGPATEDDEPGVEPGLEPGGFVVSVARSGPAQFVVTSTGMSAGDDASTYCTIAMRTRVRGGRLAERGAQVDRTCEQR